MRRAGSRLATLCSGEAAWDIAGVITITLSLLIYGVLQERIVTIGFGPHSEIFENSVFLVFCNRFITCTLAMGYILATETDVRRAAPLRSYASVSFTNVIATSCQYEALRYVSFAVQTLAKSSKALPVMLWGTMLAGKVYKPADYLHAGVITAGCTVFIVTGDVSSRVAVASSSNYAMGAALMLLYLAVDGLTSTWQDSLFTIHSMSICDQVLYTTAFSTGLSFVASVATQQLMPSINFLMRNPDAIWWILALSLSSAAVQLLISYTIKRYGALVFATIMTTRQFFSILLSSIIFWTPLTRGQWCGTLLVFLAIYYKVLRGGPARVARARKSDGGAASKVAV